MNQTVEDLAYDALNAACLSVQNALGIEHGDAAGLFFSGAERDSMMETLREYVKFEMMMKERNRED